MLPAVEVYSELKAELRQEAAAEIIRFRIAYVGALLSLADTLSLRSTSQGREVQSLSVYLDDISYRQALENLAEFRSDMPVEADGYASYEAEEARQVASHIEIGHSTHILLSQGVLTLVQRFSLSRHASGVISGPAGALWPYRLTTGILELPLAEYPQLLALETNTPVTDLRVVEDSDAGHPYRLGTPRGVIRAAKVVHCTNAHVSHPVSGLRGIIVPLRGQMSAQNPGEKFQIGGKNMSGTFNYQQGFDYLVQLPVNGPVSNGEMMLGGGISPTSEASIREFGVADNSELKAVVDMHLSGALSAFFGREDWGAVRGPSVSHMWTGIMGFSSDGHPWVGRLPSHITGRPVPSTACHEWIAAGYLGEGTVHAWLCGKALAAMIVSHEKQLNVEEDDLEDNLWIPKRFKVTDARLHKAPIPRKAD